MPKTKDGMKSVETSIPEKWDDKMKKVWKRKGKTSRRQYIRDLVYDNLKKEGEL